MASAERVTVTLPTDLIRDIDRRERNRSKFVADAVRHELDSLRRDELRRSLQNPHVERADLADEGFEAWGGALPEEDTGTLVDNSAGKPVPSSVGGWRRLG
jgi:hypothetical protein